METNIHFTSTKLLSDILINYSKINEENNMFCIVVNCYLISCSHYFIRCPIVSQTGINKMRKSIEKMFYNKFIISANILPYCFYTDGINFAVTFLNVSEIH